MTSFKKLYLFCIILFFVLNPKVTFSDNHDLYEIIELLKKDIETLERAVYSENFSANQETSVTSNTLDQNSEEVLTRHLLKLSEVEKQFQKLTNKFEEINFKLDKLSSRLSKVQADNQLRFQQLEQKINSGALNDNENLSAIPKENKKKILPGSSEPQDLGSITYKDNETNLEVQQTQSVDTNSSVVTEKFDVEEKILPERNYYSAGLDFQDCILLG